MAEDVMLNEAIDAIRKGQRSRARDLLTRLLRADQNNPEYWLWMSSVVDTQKEQVYCLQSVLRLDPNNRSAHQGLVLLGAIAPDENIVPVPPVRRQWEVKVQEVPEYSGLKAAWANPIFRAAVITIVAVVAVGLILYGVFGGASSQPARVAVIPTRTEGPPPTYTYTPTAKNFTPTPATATPTFAGVPPLWLKLDATYTPTKPYIHTPHVANEAYSSALRKLQAGDYEGALENLQQAFQMDPNAADIHFTIGEIYRAQGEYKQALNAYNTAIEVDPGFIMAHLAIVRVKLAQNPNTDILADLDKIINIDPNYGEAYLERAAYYIREGDYEAALEDLEKASLLLPDSPMIYLYRAEIDLAQGDTDTALENAQKAQEIDITLLPTYLVIGQISAENGDHDLAIEMLDIYLTYEEENAEAWLTYGKSLYATQAYSDTLTAMENALDYDDTLAEAYYYRGLVYLDLDEGQNAINELVNARRLDMNSFDHSLALSRGFLTAGRLDDALNQINTTEGLAENDTEMAAIHYWRALIYEAIGNQPSANRDWRALFALDEQDIPSEWLETADERLNSTPSPTPSLTPTPTRTPTPSKTPSS